MEDADLHYGHSAMRNSILKFGSRIYQQVIERLCLLTERHCTARKPPHLEVTITLFGPAFRSARCMQREERGGQELCAAKGYMIVHSAVQVNQVYMNRTRCKLERQYSFSLSNTISHRESTHSTAHLGISDNEFCAQLAKLLLPSMVFSCLVKQLHRSYVILSLM